MDFSRKEQSLATNTLEVPAVQGLDLVNQLVCLTGLSPGVVHEELHTVFQYSGHTAESMTLEQLREAMLSYLVLVDAEVTAANISDDQKS